MTDTPRLLALDLATVTGWATQGPFWGTVDFSARRGESPGMRFLRFEWWLNEWVGRVDLVAYEQAHHRGGAPTQVGVGMVTVLLKWCAEHQVEHIACHTSTLKKFATGSGRADKSIVIAAMRERWQIGDQPLDDNAADALALLAWALAGCPQSATTIPVARGAIPVGPGL